MDSTRRVTSALREAERGWDWKMFPSAEHGTEMKPVYVSSEESSLVANQILAEMIELGNEIRRSDRQQRGLQGRQGR